MGDGGGKVERKSQKEKEKEGKIDKVRRKNGKWDRQIKMLEKKLFTFFFLLSGGTL
jgi:hypothetical protein